MKMKIAFDKNIKKKLFYHFISIIYVVPLLLVLDAKTVYDQTIPRHVLIINHQWMENFYRVYNAILLNYEQII